METISSFVDGKSLLVSRTFEKHYPATGAVTALVDEASRASVDQAVAAARRAAKGEWRTTTMEERAALLDRIAIAMERRLSELVEAEIADTGKLLGPTTHTEIPRAIANFRAFAAVGRLSAEPRFETPLADGRRATNRVLREPVGVVGIVAPWNLPLLLLTWKIAPALLCGNTIVVKPSEHSPRTAVLLARIAIEAGLPPGVLNVVHGHGAGAAGEFLTSHPGIDALSFTGETRTGEAIMTAAARGARPVSLELGGKNAAIILEDCDLEAAVAGTLRSVFENAGQVCLTTERLFVHKSVFERFAARLSREAQGLKPGDPRDPGTGIGPMISAGHRDKVLGFYAAARAAGATVLAGGGAPQMEAAFANGFWVEPTLWAGLADDAEVCRNEVFGPCAHIAVFEDDAEAVARANDSSYGLAATIWGRDAARMERIARRLETGTVWVNCWRVRDERVAFGGRKRSGIGREGGEWSLDFYSELKTLCVAEQGL